MSTGGFKMTEKQFFKAVIGGARASTEDNFKLISSVKKRGRSAYPIRFRLVK